jgi:hypothetical protein
MANPKALLQGGGALIDLFKSIINKRGGQAATRIEPTIGKPGLEGRLGDPTAQAAFTNPTIKADPLEEFAHTTDELRFPFKEQHAAPDLDSRGMDRNSRSYDTDGTPDGMVDVPGEPTPDQLIQMKQDEAIDAVAGQIPLSRKEIYEMVEYHGYTPEELANMTPTEISDRLRAGSEYRQSDMSSDEWAMHTSEEATLTKMLQQLRGRHPSESRPINNPFEDESAVFDGTDYDDIPF